MASILEFPNNRPAKPTNPAAFSQNFAVSLPAHRRQPIVLRHAAEREAQIAAAVARSEREISQLHSIDHLNRAQKLSGTNPTKR